MIIKPQPSIIGSLVSWKSPNGRHSYIWPNEIGFPVQNDEGMHLHSPYGKPGDRLWVRETFAIWSTEPTDFVNMVPIQYRSDKKDWPDCTKWSPSIHMPRWASRIDLEITGIRVERLKDISNEDCWNEGMSDTTNPQLKANRKWFSELWESINGVSSWDANPWVWVVEFRRVKP